MEQLTQHQFKTLKLLANGKVKLYCNQSGTPKDPQIDEHNQEFNGLLRLAELGLLEDISEKCPDVVTEYKMKTGGDVAIVKITPIGQMMFEKHRWTKWKN